MLELSNFIKSIEESDDRYNCYSINRGIKIFNYTFETDDIEELQVNVSTDISIDTIINEIAQYISWFTRCETELKMYYENELGEKVNDTWFDDIEVYRISITFNSKSDYGATIHCGDKVLKDHILEIDFDCEKVEAIRLNG